MINANTNEMQKQFENFFLAPAERFAGLSVDHLEQLTNVQIAAVRAYTELGIEQARSALEIRDAEGLQRHFEHQQKVAQSVGERVQDDSEQVVSMNQKFAEKAQKLAQDNVQGATEAAAANTK